jgi:hypothetical protein
MVRLTGRDAEGKTTGDPVPHTTPTNLKGGTTIIGVTTATTGIVIMVTGEAAGMMTLEETTGVE